MKDAFGRRLEKPDVTSLPVTNRAAGLPNLEAKP
jgi:hypothetical protein